MRHWIVAVFFLCSFSGHRTWAFDPPGKAEHVVVIVWDGMRPDFVSETHTPALWKLSRDGVSFRKHHAVYPSATLVNGTAIATGCDPAHSGMVANYVFRPKIDPAKFVDAGNPPVIRKGDEVSGGKYLARETVAEILHRAGKSTAIAGTKYVTLLHDRRAGAANDAARKSFVVFQGAALPNEAIERFQKQLREFPGINDPRADEWTTKALTDVMWKERVPAYSLLWLAEPDNTQHKTAPGSSESIAALERSDKCLRAVLDALEKKGVREKTDIFVVSDHGFSTIERSIDLLPQLNDAGFRAVTEFKADPQSGDIMVVGNGGTVLFYVIGHERSVVLRLVEWLQQTDFAGVIFAREKIDGAFSLNQIRLDTPHAPDVAMAFRWTNEKNQFGAPGLIAADWNRAAGKGTHATLGRWDMGNTLIAAGPDFRRGYASDLPSGNLDLAPTILHILGLKPARSLDGRILTEAMTDGAARQPKTETETIQAMRKFPATTWRQYLQISKVGPTIYFDEGNSVIHR